MAFCIINRGSVAGAFNKMHLQYNGNLNDLTYNYYGYASPAATNAPPNLKGGLVLCSFNNSRDRGAQVYVSSESRKVYYRRYDANGWKDGWQQLNLDYVPVNKAGDSVTGNLVFSDKDIGIQRVGRSSNYITGRDKALVKTTSIVHYSPIMSIKTTNGSWEVGSYNNSDTLDDLLFTYCPDANYNKGANKDYKQIRFQEDGTIVANLSGVAARAINDNSGKNIVDTYVKKSGSTMTGKLSAKGLAMTAGNNLGAKAQWFLALEQDFDHGGSIGYVTKANMVANIGAEPKISTTSITYSKMKFYTGFIKWTTNTDSVNMPAAYKYGRVVHLFGTVKIDKEISSDNSTTWTKVLQLPEGYRPVRGDQYITYSNVDNARCVIRIDTTGDMTVQWDWNGSASKIPAGKHFHINCTFISS